MAITLAPRDHPGYAIASLVIHEYGAALHRMDTRCLGVHGRGGHFETEGSNQHHSVHGSLSVPARFGASRADTRLLLHCQPCRNYCDEMSDLIHRSLRAPGSPAANRE